MDSPIDNLNRARQRQYQKERKEQNFEEVVVETVQDIQRVLAQLDPNHRLNKGSGVANISSEVRGTGSEDKSYSFNVKAVSSDQSYRDIIMHGLQIVQDRRLAAGEIANKEMPIVVDGVEMVPPKVIGNSGALAVDSVISRLLGAYRDGELICWNLTDGYTYRYDVFVHKLDRVERDVKED